MQEGRDGLRGLEDSLTGVPVDVHETAGGAQIVCEYLDPELDGEFREESEGCEGFGLSCYCGSATGRHGFL